MAALRRLSGGSGTLLQVAVVALAAHAVVYRSLFPTDGAHGYFGWYAPLVGGLSTVALVAAILAMLSQVTGVGAPWLRRVAASSRPVDSVSVATSRLAGKAIAFLVVQETLERSIPARSFEIAQFTPLEWLSALTAATLVALVLLSASRGCQLIVARLRRLFRAARTVAVLAFRRPSRLILVARNPLASFRGLRAPPSLICV